jgi:hypothetical protein
MNFVKNKSQLNTLGSGISAYKQDMLFSENRQILNKSFQNALNAHAMGIDIIYTFCAISLNIWTFTQSIRLRPFEWFLQLEAAGFDNGMTNNFQAARSVYGSQYATNGMPALSFFVHLFSCIRIMFVDQPQSYPEFVQISKSYGFQLSTTNGELLVSPFIYALFQLGVYTCGKVSCFSTITSYLSARTEFSFDLDYTYKVESIVNESSELYIGMSRYSSKAIAQFFKQYLNSKKHPLFAVGKSIAVFELLQIPDQNDLCQMNMLWSSFLSNESSNNKNIAGITCSSDSFVAIDTLGLSIMTTFGSIEGGKMAHGSLICNQNLSNTYREILSILLEVQTSVAIAKRPPGPICLNPISVYADISQPIIDYTRSVGISTPTMNCLVGFTDADFNNPTKYKQYKDAKRLVHTKRSGPKTEGSVLPGRAASINVKVNSPDALPDEGGLNNAISSIRLDLQNIYEMLGSSHSSRNGKSISLATTSSKKIMDNNPIFERERRNPKTIEIHGV